MTNDELGKLKQQLNSDSWWFGTKRRLGAVQKLAADGTAESIPLLLEALDNPDAEVRTVAEKALRDARNRDQMEALCALAVQEPAGRVARICVETGKRPRGNEDDCLFLWVTGQLDKYFQKDQDYEFQGLRAAYDRAPGAVQAHVLAVVRGGDPRCLDFIGKRKALIECTEPEIQAAIEPALRHRDWGRLFTYFQELPMKYGFPLLEEFRKSGWVPEQRDLAALYKGVLAESAGAVMPPPPKPIDANSPVFEKWLAEGRTGSFAGMAEGELVRRLGECAPADGVRIVAALAGKVQAGKVQAGSSAEAAVRTSPHWLVRLAGYSTGLCKAGDLGRDSVEDGNYWVTALVKAAPVLELWPARSGPSELEALERAPREAFSGRFGAVRRVLRLLLRYRTTEGEISRVVFEDGGTGAVLTRVPKKK